MSSVRTIAVLAVFFYASSVLADQPQPKPLQPQKFHFSLPVINITQRAKPQALIDVEGKKSPFIKSAIRGPKCNDWTAVQITKATLEVALKDFTMGCAPCSPDSIFEYENGVLTAYFPEANLDQFYQPSPRVIKLVEEVTGKKFSDYYFYLRGPKDMAFILREKVEK